MINTHRFVIPLAGNAIPYTARGIITIVSVSRDDMNMTVEDSLACSLACVEPYIVPADKFKKRTRRDDYRYVECFAVP